MNINKNCTCGKKNLKTTDCKKVGRQVGPKYDLLLGNCKSCNTTLAMFKSKENKLTSLGDAP